MGVDVIFLLSIMLIIFVMLLFIVLEDRRKIVCMEKEARKQKMAEKKHDLAIVLNEPSLQTIWDLSMDGKRMPKKTTFFFPKIWSGFVFYLMR